MPKSSTMALERLIHGSSKIRKRGCSSSSSSSSRLHNYKFKRAILVGKARVGSRSSTPAPAWRTAGPLPRPNVESPKYAASIGGEGNKSRPVSARKLAATLWEMNEIPRSPAGSHVADESLERRVMRREKRMAAALRSVQSGSGSLPPHLSDPSHSPVSERMDRSGTGSRHRGSSSMSQRPRLINHHNAGILDSLSSASLMEIESGSRLQTPRGSSFVCVRNRLKDVSNALTTSKELLKIINRVWAPADQPSSSMSLVSALHAELEKARLQVNQLIREQHSDHSEIDYLMKCFAEEKAAWSKEHKVVRAAVTSVSAELEVERKLRRRLESLNKKLGKELAETKVSLLEAVKELDDQKITGALIEQERNKFLDDVGEVEDLTLENVEAQEKNKKGRDMVTLADMLNHHFDEKNAVVDKLKKQLEATGRTTKRGGDEKGFGSSDHGHCEEVEAYLNRTHFASHQRRGKEDDARAGEIVDSEKDSTESDLHSIELNMNNNNRKHIKWAHKEAGHDPVRASVGDEMRGRNSTAGMIPRKSTTLQRSISNCLKWGPEAESFQQQGEWPDRDGFCGVDNLTQRKSSDEIHRYKSTKERRDHSLFRRDLAIPTQQWNSLGTRDMVQERPTIL